MFSESDIDWEVLRKVLLKVVVGISSTVAAFALLALSIEWFGKWTLTLIPVVVLYYVIKCMYHDELVRQGKRLH